MKENIFCSRALLNFVEDALPKYPLHTWVVEVRSDKTFIASNESFLIECASRPQVRVLVGYAQSLSEPDPELFEFRAGIRREPVAIAA